VTQAAAVKAGAGVALLPHFIGRADDSLVPRSLKRMPPARQLWLVTRRLDRKNLTIRTVIDFLTQVFLGERELFEET
jgi:DNA-binding transcriptional LysR family regulator